MARTQSTKDRPREDQPLRAILWMLLTGVFFVCVTGIVRYIGSDLPAAEAAFIRYAFGLIFILPALVRFTGLGAEQKHRAALEEPGTSSKANKASARGSLWQLSTKQWRGFAVRGLLHGFAVMLWFYAMARIPIAEVTAIGYTAPIFVTIGAALFLGERLQIRRIAAVLAAFLGALIILRPGFQELSSGQLAQLMAAPLFAASFLMAKRMTDDTDPAIVVAMLSLFCTLVLLPGALWSWQEPTSEQVMWLALTAAFATAGHFTMMKAFECAPITVTQPVQFLQLVWAAIMGVALFGEPIDPWVMLGGAVIVGSATYISHREMVVARRSHTPPAPATKL